MSISGLRRGRVGGWEFKVGGVTERLLQVCDFLRSGQLVTCLAQYAPDDRGHYICYLSRQQLPSRIRVFIDHMAKRMRALDLECLQFSPIAA